ncbi:MAG: heavy-metal-associated domain-containing protein [Puia sp.]
MSTIQFKTNINCGGCIARATPALNEVVGNGHWQVDTQNPGKVLTVNSDTVDESQIRTALNKAGFKAERI